MIVRALKPYMSVRTLYNHKSNAMATVAAPSPDQLKDAVLNVLKENPDILKEAIKQLLTSGNDQVEESAEARKLRMRALIQEDFDQYEEVFKALA